MARSQQISTMDHHYDPAHRLEGFDKPRVWSVLTPLAQELKAANLGQGFPTWDPPQFYLDFLREQAQKGNHQYVRSYGSVPLVNSIAQFHRQAFHPHKIDPLNDIVISNGGSEALFCCFLGMVNPGDQVIFFDPAYDCYRSQIQMAGGKSVGFPLRPRHKQTKAQVGARITAADNKVVSGEADDWVIDFEKFEQAFNEKTKVLLINSPHNPVGKVFTQGQLRAIAQIVQKYPRVVIIEDNVYEGMIFDEMLGGRLPKIIHEPGMYERTVSVYSAGKIFAATGVRCGWAIGSPRLIQSVRSVHQYNVFCYYNLIEMAIAKSMEKISQPEDDYMVEYPRKLQQLRDLLVEQLVKCDLDINFWVPKGSNFIIVDISRCHVKQEYMFDEHKNRRARDYAFSLQLLYENGVSVIPCSPFYDEANIQDRENYVRLTFCKDEGIIKTAGERLKTKSVE